MATLFGKAFVRIEEDAVTAAVKLIASAALTRKHIAINIGPSGTWSKTLKENETTLKCKVGFNFFFYFLTVLTETSSTSLIVIRINTFRISIF